jgi:hypothetical protein
MKQTGETEPYWTHNLILGEGDVQNKQSLIRLHLHRSEETFHHAESLFPIPSQQGKRTYFHAKPYILIPKMIFTVGLTRPKADSGEIGRVIGSDVTKLQKLEIGNAQAWYYPTERALVLWECFLFQPFAKKDLLHDVLFAKVWKGFETTLLKVLPDTTRIYTTYEPIYEWPVFKNFLASMQYRPIKKVAFVKEVS